jgi:hypothetical protein
LNKDWLLIEKNKEKLDIHQSFKTNLNSIEKFDLFVRSYNIDEQLDSESLDSLNLFYKSKSISEFEVEINKDRCFLSNLDKFLNEKEAKICMNFDHINKKKRKRDVFEDSTNSSVLNDSERLEKLKKYFDEKATISKVLKKSKPTPESEVSEASDQSDQSDDSIEVITTGLQPPKSKKRAKSKKSKSKKSKKEEKIKINVKASKPSKTPKTEKAIKKKVNLKKKEGIM